MCSVRALNSYIHIYVSQGINSDTWFSTISSLQGVSDWYVRYFPYLTEIHRLDTFATKRRTNRWTRSSLACWDYNLHHLADGRAHLRHLVVVNPRLSCELVNVGLLCVLNVEPPTLYEI